MDRFCGLYVSIIETFSRYDRESVELSSLRGWVDRAVRMFVGSCSEGILAIQPDTTLVDNNLFTATYFGYECEPLSGLLYEGESNKNLKYFFFHG